MSALGHSGVSLQNLSSEFLEQYEIFEINEGGFAYVFGVTDRLTGEEFAVKVPRSASTADEFANEVAIWIELDPHPNIVTARFVRDLRGKPALFMEYVRGTSFRTLRELMAMGPLSQETALVFAFQTCLGMEFANRGRELVHLDLKPENLLISSGTLLKITDFGLAHQVRIVKGRYQRRFAGSWPYAPPERFQQEPCDTRSDMFPVGVILYEMLTGKLPYPFVLDEDPVIAYAQLAAFHAKGGIGEIANDLYHRGLPGFPKEVGEVLSTFLQADRGERPMHFQLAISLFQDIGVHQLSGRATKLSSKDKVARVSALQAIGEHSAALTILNDLLIKEPNNGEYYMAAIDSLVATGQPDLAEKFRRRARDLESRNK